MECDDRAAQEDENDCYVECVVSWFCGLWSCVEVSGSGCALLNANCGRRGRF